MIAELPCAAKYIGLVLYQSDTLCSPHAYGRMRRKNIALYRMHLTALKKINASRLMQLKGG
jgi:hypothetical protein